MSTFTNREGEVLLSIIPPVNKIEPILQELDLPNFQELEQATFEQKRILFLVVFRGFLKGDFFLEELSEVASAIKMLFPTNRSKEQAEYEHMIYEVADFSIFIREYSEPHGSSFDGLMENAWKYFYKYRNLLDSLSEKYALPAPVEK